MTRKEIKNFAKKIAKYEEIIANTQDPDKRHAAEVEIMALSGKVDSLEDMARIDEVVQDLIKTKS